MRIRRNANNVNGETRKHLWVLLGGTCVALTAAALTFPVKTVLADALLSRPTVATSAAAKSPTPALEEAGEAKKQDLLHGVASWYGPRFNGRKTASGERFNMYGMTACHPTLPFGTVVRVVNRRNHRSVDVRITDRGALKPGRIIDLSYEAARKLHMAHDGLAEVDLQVLPPKSPARHN